MTGSVDFLKSIYGQAQEVQPGLTLAKFAEKLGIGYSSLKMILAGKRKLTLPQLYQITQMMKLSKQESEYLETLLLMEKAKKSSDRHYYLNRAKVATHLSPLKSIVVSDSEVLKDHLLLPILIYLSDLQAEVPTRPFSKTVIKTVVQRFRISEERAKQACDLIEKLDLLSQTKQGDECHFVYSRMSQALNQKQYLRSWLEESAKRIERDYNDPSTYFTAVTISVDGDSLLALKNELKLLFEKYLSLGEKNKPKDQLAQVCVQLYPLT
jgi:uncharacterized protein (TIGR02147 family)